ncbi:hypothetical protein fugu_016060 [Takifugu bimaculatus]|uniref:Succinate--hydroxymethylglutarate CoA-transferase n=1 Tax=Takifugu bimaculatus TaxID=433685 RepID=A0A4Z2BWD4_9TELE|nr:hypothetical protein fugu_016060 [Takifugu bimaculatus]
MSGMMHITGPEEGEPVRPGVAMTDLAAGLYAHGAVMAALLQRHRTGTGSHIDCNLLSAQVSCLSHIAANYLNCGWEARRWGTAHESIVPYQAFTTKDGHVVVAAGNDKQFVKVCQHTVQVLRNTLSYTDDAIKSLLASKVVAQNVAS